MKLVLTLLARDEADIVDANLAFHLNAGVDFVVATDNRSQDGTTEILESYAREGHLRLIREESDAFDQSAWVTRMARLAATEYDADWVINSDADEFWWPRGGDLKEVLGATPPRYGVLRAPIRHFFLTSDDDGFFAERMIVRPRLSAPVNQPENPLRPNTHALHRADPNAVVTAGNHALSRSSLVLFPGWHPIEVLHFPLRNIEQARRKYANWVQVRAGREYPDAFEANERGQLGEFVRGKILAPDVVERGLADESLVEDTRLRDALRALAGGVRIELPKPSPVDEAVYASEVAVLAEADLVRLQRHLDELEARIASLETGLAPRARRAVFSLLRR
jgi:Glycosyl transferase family 2